MITTVLSISAGAAIGALLRWKLGAWLNAAFPGIPPGTLAANLVGAYLIGLAVAYFANHPELPPEWRLLVVTGFLGGLTTFSTFSAEVVTNMMDGRWAMAAAGTATHVVGSFVLTALGIWTVGALRSTSLAAGG